MDLNNISQEQVEETVNKVENVVNKYIRIRNIIGLILFFIILIFIAIAFFTQDKTEEQPTTETPTETVNLTESERIVWDNYLTVAKRLGFIDKSNLEKIELVSIQDYGKYTKSHPDLRYEQLNFTYTCKDGTTDCVKLETQGTNNGYYSQLVTIDLNNKDYIKIGGLSFGMDEVFVDVTEPFTFYELEK